VTYEELKSVCHPLKVQVWEVGDKGLLEVWKSPERATYSGCHGFKTNDEDCEIQAIKKTHPA
jgi:hypothetical protein